jgi:hypothetical protein
MPLMLWSTIAGPRYSPGAVGTNFNIRNLPIGATTANITVQITNGVTLNMAVLTIGTGGTLNVDAGRSFFQSGGFTNWNR